ncbi:MAG: hypothetical protein NT077_04760, partial [Candidatus Taylorbacteria bacterium]|nr:hypothetical protein [Candidatus Taylorbacteria bacterium]
EVSGAPSRTRSRTTFCGYDGVMEARACPLLQGIAASFTLPSVLLRAPIVVNHDQGCTPAIPTVAKLQYHPW